MINYSQILKTLKGLVRPNPGLQMGPLGSFIQSKKAWLPFPMNPPEGIPEDRLEALQRCLALALALELPVGDWVQSQNDLDPQEALALTHNAKDELTHYEAFERAFKAYGATKTQLQEAYQFAQRLEELPEHLVLKAGFVELSIFFVMLALMRRFGDSQLKLLTKYVSRDESCHVRTNYHLIDKHGLRFQDFEAINHLRASIIRWVTEPLKSQRHGSEFWETQSQNLMQTRKSSELKSLTDVGIMPAFFEMPSY